MDGATENASEMSPTSYIGHHLTFLTHPFREGEFWAINVDTLVTSIFLGVVAFGFLCSCYVV